MTVESNVELGDPDTGNHHVHLCFDTTSCDEEYELVFGDTFDVSDLSPGEHTIVASLRHADHSDAGVSDEITVTVGDGGGMDPDTEKKDTGDNGGGYDY